MELYSLEEDDARDLFITQTPCVDNGGAHLSSLVEDEMDFSVPLRSFVAGGQNANANYSDISDDDVFEIPCSQVDNTKKSRYVHVNINHGNSFAL